MADPNSPVVRFQVWRASLPPAIRFLLTANIVTYLVFVALSIVRLATVLEWVTLPGDPALALVRPWTVLTYGFANLYGGFFGLISFAFAMAWLNWIGRDIEESYGSHQMLGLYLLAILGGAAFALAVGAFGASPRPYFGAWAPVGAVVVAAAVLHPNRGIGLLFIGVISLKWIAIVFVVLDLAFNQDPTHFGAYLTGGLFGLAAKRGIELGAWTKLFFRGGGTAASPTASFGGASGGFGGGRFGRRGGGDDAGESWKRSTTATAPSRTVGRSKKPSAPTQADVDRILEKIHAEGMDSLSKAEKKILEAWSGQG